jgi:hypothetical protein
MIEERRLRTFGHVARSDGSQDHARALRAMIRGTPKPGRDRLDDQATHGPGRSIQT